MKSPKPLSIGQVSRQAGVAIETVRFYERQGLIAEPARKASGYRQYTDDVVPRLLFIKRAKDLGFSLSEVAEFLALRADSSTTCDEVRRSASEKIEEIVRKMGDLDRMKNALVELVNACDERTSSECPFLVALAKQDAGLGEDPSSPGS
ncbi:MAG TPA: heavy metal-responsive transcriptional regulator [Thermoanaerobaculia bacterium]|nr:heavy metal-responsive transcriptional regulator [Thermoanaerobaculia bacterium]